jgi:hypothetical protein
MNPLFKFRSEKQFSYAMDIILNKRLYCADWREMNDPMEGWAVPDVEKVYSGEIAYNKVIDVKQNLRVCSLSTTFNSHLLWAHFANGFKGMAIEVDVPVDLLTEVKCINDLSENFPNTKDPELIARECLRRKHAEWEYEREVRIIQRAQYVKDVLVRRVIVGHRMNKSLLKTLNKVCGLEEIEFCGLGFSGNEIVTLPLNGDGMIVE